MNNPLIKKIKILSLGLLALILFDGCRPAREVTPVPDPMVMTPQKLLMAVHAEQASFDFFSTRFSGVATLDDRNYNVSGNIRIQKDSAIFVSVAPFLGIEVARAMITPDTVKFINRLENTYFVGDMGFINRMLNTDLDFFMLQSLLVGSDFEHFTSDNFQLRQDRGMLLLHAPDRKRAGHSTQAYQHNLWLDQNSFRIQQALLFQPEEKRLIRTNYKNFVTVEGQKFPSEVSLEFSDPGSRAELSMSYSRTSVNNPRQMTFSIPSRYSPLDF